MSGLTALLLIMQLLGLPLQIIGLYLCSKRFMRDYMAAKAMQGLLCSHEKFTADADASAPMKSWGDFASGAYQLADAMIKARKA